MFDDDRGIVGGDFLRFQGDHGDEDGYEKE